MSTAKFNQWLNSDGTENYKCRAWVNFNGTGTVAIRAAGNVSSITDNGVGSYTVNFTTAMSDASYSAGASSDLTGSDNNLNRGAVPSNLAYNLVQVRTGIVSANAAEDHAYVMAAIFR